MKQRIRIAWRVLRGKPVMVGITMCCEGEAYVLKEKGMWIGDNRFQTEIQTPPQPREAFVSLTEMVMRSR